MSESIAQFAHVKNEYKPAPIMSDEAMREYLMTERQTTIMRLAAIEKMLGIEPTRPRNQQRRVG